VIGALAIGVLAGVVGFALGDRRRARLERQKVEQDRARAEFGRRFMP
jgi:hypothetical protein